MPALPIMTTETTCPCCGTRNRVGAYSVSKRPRCAVCKAGLKETIDKVLLRWLSRHWLLAGVGVAAAILSVVQPAMLSDLSARSPTATLSSVPAALCPGIAQPRSGLYADYTPGLLPKVSPPLTIATREGTNYFVRFYTASSGSRVLSLFIQGGSTVRQRMPYGTVIMKYANGERWCGETDLFGPTTSVNVAGKQFTFDDEIIRTIELIPQRNGNLPMRSISRTEF